LSNLPQKLVKQSFRTKDNETLKNHRFKSGSISIIIGIVILLPFILFSLFPFLFATHDPIATSVLNRLSPPFGEYLFGTDELGRDLFSRIVYGSRISMFAAVITISIATLVGTFIGVIAGYKGGWVDEFLMRLVDLTMAFPSLLLAIAIAAAAGPGIVNSTIAIAAVWWPQYARLTRGVVISIKKQPFIDAAIVIGGSNSHIMRAHLLPNLVTPVLIRMTIDFGYAILFLASLGFLGLGEPPPYPEWGTLLYEGRRSILSYWWPSVFPGIALTLVTLGVTFLGDGLTDRLDPRLRRS